MRDMADGTLGAAFWTNAGAYNHRKGGRIKVLAVSGNERNFMLEDVPTFEEQGFENFDVVPWIGAFVPAGTPQATIDTLSASINNALQDTKVSETLRSIGFVTREDSPAAFQERLDAERERWEEIIEVTGFTPN